MQKKKLNLVVGGGWYLCKEFFLFPYSFSEFECYIFLSILSQIRHVMLQNKPRDKVNYPLRAITVFLSIQRYEQGQQLDP